MISEHISNDIPPQIKILTTVIPILMHFYSFLSKPYKVTCHPTECDIINDVKLFQTVYHRIYSRKCLTLSNQMLYYKSKCIRTGGQ